MQRLHLSLENQELLEATLLQVPSNIRPFFIFVIRPDRASRIFGLKKKAGYPAIYAAQSLYTEASNLICISKI